MMDFVYMLILVGWGILFLALYIKDYPISAIASFFLMALGMYIINNGLVGTDNFATQFLGIIQLCVGFYVLVRGAYELYKNF